LPFVLSLNCQVSFRCQLWYCSLNSWDLEGTSTWKDQITHCLLPSPLAAWSLDRCPRLWNLGSGLPLVCLLLLRATLLC
jgi:hypothetical protein